MNKKMSARALCLSLAIGTAFSGTALYAASNTKTLKAVYNNIKVSYDGQLKSMSIEPFLINGSVYVPLRGISEVTGSSVNWANNTVYITSGNTVPGTSQLELQNILLENASLKQQLASSKAELEKYKKEYESEDLSSSSVSKTLKEIKDRYDDDYHVEWDFDLREKSSRLELTISYDSRDDGSDFNDISSSKLEDFIEDICKDIQDNHPRTEIRGTVEDSRYDRKKASFEFSKSGSIDFDKENISDDLRDLEDDLEDDYKHVDAPFSLPVESISLSDKNDTITYTVYIDLDTDSLILNWNKIDESSSDKRKVEDFMREVKKDIERKFDMDVEGIIKDEASSRILSQIADDNDFEYRKR